jgi:hypothetical protein
MMAITLTWPHPRFQWDAITRRRRVQSMKRVAPPPKSDSAILPKSDILLGAREERIKVECCRVTKMSTVCVEGALV